MTALLSLFLREKMYFLSVHSCVCWICTLSAEEECREKAWSMAICLAKKIELYFLVMVSMCWDAPWWLGTVPHQMVFPGTSVGSLQSQLGCHYSSLQKPRLWGHLVKDNSISHASESQEGGRPWAQLNGGAFPVGTIRWTHESALYLLKGFGKLSATGDITTPPLHQQRNFSWRWSGPSEDKLGFSEPPSKLHGCTASSSICANQVPAHASPLSVWGSMKLCWSSPPAPWPFLRAAEGHLQQ